MAVASGIAGAARLEVDLGAIARNWRQLADRAAPARCGAPVKADAYGLGAAKVVPALARAGCRDFFFAHPGEALAVRDLAPGVRLYALHGPTAAVDEMAARGVVPTLNTLDQVAVWRDAAARAGRRLPATLQVDTGMNRLGLEPADFERLAREPARLDGLDLLLVFSHLACADIPGHPLNAAQLAAFRRLRALFPAVPAALANSSGIFLGPEYSFDLVRPGAALYGINPLTGAPNPMEPVVRLVAEVIQVRRVDAPASVGYGAEHAVTGPSRVATIAVGYADGYPRSLGNGRGQALVDGERVPVIGRVSMDLITLDVSSLAEHRVQPGTEAILLGPEIDPDLVGTAAGTIGYEILTRLGPRYRRVYVEDTAGAAPAR
ncbi:alanine racemase [Desertibaculum subflavum]|uniref:alanine racemase n=1 Tax=Desertibaculum subflavum TaxID=2268458 RepID=UPI000E675B06